MVAYIYDMDPDTLNFDLVQDFGPTWIRIDGIVINFEKNVFKKLRWGKVPLKKISFLKQEYNGTGRSFLVSWVTEW